MASAPTVRAPPPAIVVVDDLASNLTLMREAMRFTTGPLQVLTILGGEAALQYVGSLLVNHGPCPHLILLDVAMPGINGFAVLSMLKQHPETAIIHVCMCSASTAPAEITKARRLGANSFVEKPVTFDGIMSLLNDAECWIQDMSSSHQDRPFPKDLISITPPSTRSFQVC